MGKFTIGIDLGGTNLKAGVVDGMGKVVARKNVPVEKDRSVGGIVAMIKDAVKELNRGLKTPVQAIGCGIPGIVEQEKGIVIRSPHFPEWEKAPMRDEIQRAVGLPIVLDNDANMHAIGEYLQGAGRGTKNMVLLTLGTGIGGGIIVEGKLVHGDEGFAGEVGHIVVEPDGPPCGCGGMGCLELYAASRAFEIHAARLPNKEMEEFLETAGKDISELTPKIVAELANGGDHTAIKLWKTFGRYLGIGIATLVNVLGVDTFIIGGGIIRSWNLFIDSARKSALNHTYRHHADKLVLKKALLGDDAGIVGAALLTLQKNL